MSLHDAPDAADLVSVVAELLHERVLDAVEDELRWQVRVAANVLDIVARELREDPTLPETYAERLQLLGYSDDSGLSAAIRDGSLRYDDPDLRVLVAAAVEARLRVSKPAALG